MNTLIAPAAPRRPMPGASPGGTGVDLPAAAHDRMVLKSRAAAAQSVEWDDMPEAVLTDFGAVGDGVTPMKAALDAAIASLPGGNSGVVLVPPGQWAMDGQTTVPNGVLLRGMGVNAWWGNAQTAVPTRGSILKWIGGGAPLQLGTDEGTVSNAGAACENLIVFAYNGPASGVTVVGPKARLINCVVYGGTSSGVNISGHGFKAVGTDVLMNGVGTAWLCGGSDHHIHASVTQGYQYGFLLSGGGLYATANHLFTSSVTGSNDVRITGGGKVQLTANVFENCMSDVFSIIPGSGVTLDNVVIASNLIYADSSSRTPDVSVIFRVNATATGSGVSNMVLGSNAVQTANRDLAIAHVTGNVTQWSLQGVHHSRAQHILAPGSLRPDAGLGLCSVNDSATEGANVKRSENRGVITGTGDGARTSFPAASGHGVDSIAGASTPATRRISMSSADAANAAKQGVWANVTGTAISAEFLVAPPVGAQIVVDWEVEA